MHSKESKKKNYLLSLKMNMIKPRLELKNPNQSERRYVKCF
jgi:hypothetical protein